MKKLCESYNTDYFQLENSEQVNNYSSEKTNGKINNICDLKSEFINIIIVLSSFEGVWKYKFSEYIEKKPFANSNGTTVFVETMNGIFSSQKYYKDENVEIISLPYQSNKLDFNMIIILPNLTNYSSPLDYINKENIDLSEIYSKLKDTENIHLHLPKFIINYRNDITNILKEIGIKINFEFVNYR